MYIAQCICNLMPYVIQMPFVIQMLETRCFKLLSGFSTNPPSLLQCLGSI